jgi:hypothetical protein
MHYTYSRIIIVRGGPMFVGDQCSWGTNDRGGPMFVGDQGSWGTNVHGGPMFVVDQWSWGTNVRGGPMIVGDQCSCGTNVRGFRGSPLPTNLHPHEHAFISYYINIHIVRLHYLLATLEIKSPRTSRILVTHKHWPHKLTRFHSNLILNKV